MLYRSKLFKVVAVVLATLLPGALCAETVPVPNGTRVFLELDQQVVSKKHRNRPGTYVRAHVWSDVIVDGRTVIEAGTPAVVQVDRIKGAKVAGIKGRAELKALSVTAADGSSLLLDGGYYQVGRSRMALSVALAVVVFAPLIFIPGKNARLEPGTVFDAMVANPASVEVGSAAVAAADLVPSPLAVEVAYDLLEAAAAASKRVKELPLRITILSNSIARAEIIEVNDRPVAPIPIELSASAVDGDGVLRADASVAMKDLSKHLDPGYNRFTIDVDGTTDTVLLDVEL